MTNTELQNIIDIGDICIFNDYIDDEMKFVGYEYCIWMKDSRVYDTCRQCKGNMVFENCHTGLVGEGQCHSHTGVEGTNRSNIEIIKKCHKPISVSKILSKELFEI